ncbi:MAG: DUF3010 family protein [Bacteroidales bacterium]|nr:DUF3010 family protein [Bacteroidales bacterium]
MRVIGIEIDKKRVTCFALEQDSQEAYINLTGNFKYLEIKDDQDNGQIRSFQSAIYTFFNSINPDVIAIIARQPKGRFSSSTFSFKLEGLIQCYDRVEIEFVSPRTLAAYYKNNSFSVLFDNNYQENVAKLAYYIFNR